MSGTAPPAPPPAGMPAAGASAAGAPQPASSNRGMVFAILGVVLALVIGGTAVAAYRALSGGGAQPAEALPGDAIGYFRLDADPSAGQKISAVRLMNKFPAFADLTGITNEEEDLRRRAFEWLQQSTGMCRQLTYEQDVASWLGSRVGVAILPPEGGGEPGVAVAVEVTDRGTADDALQAIARCSGWESVAYTPVGEDYLLFAASQALADRYAAAAQAAPLSDDEQFVADMDRLGDQGILSGWMSVQRLADAVPAEAGLDLSATAGADSAAMALRFADTYVELAGITTGSPTPADVTDNPVVNLPESTLAALSVSAGAQLVDPMWSRLESTLAESGESIDVLARQVEDETGLVLPQDLKTLLGENLTLAVDATGLDAQGFAETGLPGDVRFGARVQTDPQAFHAVLDKLVRFLGAGATPFQTTDGDGFVTVATNAGYADQLAADGGLGEQANFQEAVANPDDAVSVLYANFDAVEKQVVQAMRQSGESERTVANLRPVAAIGMSSWVVEDGVYEFSLRLAVN